MKFTYDTKPDERECKAYIDLEGDLVIKCTGGSVVWTTKEGFKPTKALHRFYPGDSITITFE